MKKLVIWLLTAALLLTGCASQLTQTEQTEPSLQTQQTEKPQESTGETEPPKTKAPDFTAYDAEGNAVKLSDYVGKPVVLNFWASWCGPCTSEMPEFQKAFEKYGEEIQFLMVNLTDGYSETVETALSYVAGKGFTFPVLFDKEYSAATVYNIRSIPATYFIDKDGNLVTYVVGALTAFQLQRRIELIQQK